MTAIARLLDGFSKQRRPLRSLGASVTEEQPDLLRIRGVGLDGLEEPSAAIDCGNAGTLARLLPGLLAGQDGRRFELTGDESLRSRPMERVAAPLVEVGTAISDRVALTAMGGVTAPLEAAPALISGRWLAVDNPEMRVSLRVLLPGPQALREGAS